MPINKTNIDLLHEPCEPVAAEFGDDPEEASKLMHDADLDGPKLASEIAIAQRWQHALGGAIIKDPTELFESGASAKIAKAKLKCGSCAVSNCLVKDDLDAAAVRASRAILDVNKNLANEPLKNGPESTETKRGGEQEPDTRAISALLNIAESNPDLNIYRPRGEVKKTPASELSALEGLRLKDPNAELGVSLLVVAGVDTPKPLLVEVVDASNVVNNSNIEPANKFNFMNLTGKLLRLCTQLNDKGEPQAFNPKDKMSKRLFDDPGGKTKMIEVRGAGKSRLYYIAQQPVENHETGNYRVVILGSNGDSASDQSKIIDSIIDPATARFQHKPFAS